MSNVTATGAPRPPQSTTAQNAEAKAAGKAAAPTQASPSSAATQTGSAAAAQAAQSANQASEVKLNPQLAGARNGQTMEGQVGRDQQGNTTIKTELGTFTLKGQSLPQGAAVTVKFAEVSQQAIQAWLTSQGGKPVQPPLAMNLILTGLDAKAMAAGKAGAMLNAGMQLNATVLASPQGVQAGQLQPGSQLLLNVLGFEGGEKAALGGKVLSGVVTGKAEGGNLLLKTDLGTLKLDVNAVLNNGSKITLELLSQTGPKSLSADLPVKMVPPSWPAMTELLEVLKAIDPSAAQRVMNQMPSAGPKIGANMMFFLSALQGGGAKDWLGGDTLKLLERMGRGDLVKRLDGDFAQMARLSSDPGGNDWRAMMFPFFDGRDINHAQMFMRSGGDGKNGEEGGDSKRFVVELNLSELGELQFDAIFVEKEKVFNLVVRSKQPLDEDFRDGIRGIYAGGAALSNVKGGVNFMVEKEFPIKPAEEHAGLNRAGGKGPYGATTGGFIA